MKPTLYEALGLSRTATEADIKGALRRLVRRYYTRTRTGHADVEEALRFLNHASHILGNPARRAEYDANLADAASSPGPSISATFQAEIAMPGETELTDSLSQAGLPRERPAPPPPEVAPELSSQLADIRRTPAGQLAALVATALVLVGAWVLVVPVGGALPLLGFTFAMVAALAVFGGIVLAIVHLLSTTIWRLPPPENPLTLVEGMIPRWRKDRTVFLGTGAPVEDATWLFRLRMAELKRVKAERVSDPRPGMRLLARLFDYSLWGLAFAGAVTALANRDVLAAPASSIALHPLVAPLLVGLTWIPVEALLLAWLQTTPGRWLMCVYLQHGVSNPYAPEDLRFTYATALTRACDVWLRGCVGWIPLLSMIAAARARELVTRSGETRWDSQRDCLVTHGPVGRMSFVTLALGLMACALVYGARWKEPMRDMTGGAMRVAAGWLPSPSPSASTSTSAPSAAPEQAQRQEAPVVSAPQLRISRIDDATPAPGSNAASPTGSSTASPVASGSSSPAEAARPAAAATEPPLSPSVASNRAMMVENEKPQAVTRVNEDAGSSETSPAVPPPAPAPAATGSAPARPVPPVASQPPAPAPAPSTPAAASPAPSSPVPAAPAPAEVATDAGSNKEGGAIASAKTFLANLFRKSAPADAPAPAPAKPEPPPPSPIELRERRVGEYMRQAQRQQSAGDYAGLVRTCTRWADDDWKNPRAYYCLGLGLQGTGQHKQAMAMFNKAGSLLPRDDPLKQQISDAVIRSFRAQTGGQ